mgnify:CR=1 FL=1
MLVTIYIPTRNRLPLLKRAINSVREQSYNEIELIVVDDCSCDGTREFLVECESRGELKGIYQEASAGACVARNLAISASSGVFVTGLDDDDYFMSSSKISNYVSQWQNSHLKLAGLFDCAKVLSNGHVVEQFTSTFVDHLDLRRSNYVGNQVFAPKHHFVGAGLFDPEMPAWQDWDLWLRMSRLYGGFANIKLFGTHIDERHALDRISSRSQEVIREAMNKLINKLGPLSLRERSYLISALHSYPQVRPTISEIATIIAGRRLQASLSSIAKLVEY